MASTGIYICQYCGKKIRLSKEEKETMSVIACEECREKYEMINDNGSEKIVKKVLDVKDKVINKLIEKESGSVYDAEYESEDNYESETKKIPETLAERLKTGIEYIVKGKQ